MEIIRCKRCVMDNRSDKNISFDASGNCNYCSAALRIKNTTYFPNSLGQVKIQEMIKEIKKASKNKKYDCIMGLSGGLDSSYLAYLGYKWGLRVLAVHIDDGYDTPVSSENLKRIIKATGFDYEIIKPDELQYNALTLAFMKAGVPNLAIPQDNCLLAFLHKKMREYGIKYFLAGGNFASECILQKDGVHTSKDVVNIIDINRKFGSEKINKLEFISTVGVAFDSKIRGLKTIKPLNYVEYNLEKAMDELSSFCGFKYYGKKHLENHLTAFIQLYWYPKKFGIDKRTSHLSSLIISDQLDRKTALQELSKPLYNDNQMYECIKIVCAKLGIDEDELNRLVDAPNHNHEDYKTENHTVLYKMLRLIKKSIPSIQY